MAHPLTQSVGVMNMGDIWDLITGTHLIMGIIPF